MFGSFGQVRQNFANQFEPEGDHFLFRKNMKEAPVPVSVTERDRYIAIYNRHITQSQWCLAIATVLLIGSLVTLEMLRGEAPSTLLLYAGLTALIIAFVARDWWVRGIPSRELKNRTTTGEIRSRAEWRRVYLQRTSYSQLAITIIFAAVMLVAALNGPRSGWDIFWIILSPLLLIVTVLQLFLKWRLRANPAKTPPGN